jgi:thiamine pyrophosphokinase
LKPDFAVGDWDSLSSLELLSQLKHLTLPRKKDRSDLFFALTAAVHAGVQEVVCLGVTGGRSDHHLAALFDLSEFATGRYGALKSVQARGLDGDFIFLSQAIPNWSGELKRGQIVSVFAMSPVVRGLTLRGFRYPLEETQLKPSSLGLSNESILKKCEVRLRNGKLLVIIPQDEMMKDE